MRRGTSWSCWLLALALLPVACGGGAGVRPTTPTPAPARAPTPPPDPSAGLVGHWLYSANVGGDAYTGTMDLTRGADGTWAAKVADNAMGETPVKAVKVDGTTVTVTVIAGDNDATVVGTLQADGTLVGHVLVNGGEGTFSAKKG